MVDTGGLVVAALILVVLPFGIQEVRKRHGVERTLATVSVAAAVLVSVLGAARSLGWLSAGPLYSTLRIALSVLFFGLVFQLVRGRRSA